jgi:hypothetical protein
MRSMALKMNVSPKDQEALNDILQGAGYERQRRGLSHLRGRFSFAQDSNTSSIVFKVSKAISSSLNQLHFSMKAFSYAV